MEFSELAREEVVKTYVMVIGLTKKPIEIDKYAVVFFVRKNGGFSGVVKPMISRSCLEMGELSGTWLYSECHWRHWHDQKNVSGRHRDIPKNGNFTWQRKVVCKPT